MFSGSVGHRAVLTNANGKGIPVGNRPFCITKPAHNDKTTKKEPSALGTETAAIRNAHLTQKRERPEEHRFHVQIRTNRIRKFDSKNHVTKQGRNARTRRKSCTNQWIQEIRKAYNETDCQKEAKDFVTNNLIIEEQGLLMKYRESAHGGMTPIK